MDTSRRDFLRSLTASALGASMLRSRAWAAAPSRPNIVLIFIDDMGYGDIEPFGSTKNRTPHLNRMASEGMKLTSFYCAPVCSVSRAQVITGCYGQRVSVPGVFFPGQPVGLNPEEHSVAELVREQGYATMCVGKWHLGDQPEFLPTRHGFDHYFGLPYSNDMIKKEKASGRPVVPLMRDDQVVELVDGEGQDQLTARYTEEACRFITEHRDQPFFLYLAHSAVHVPIHPGKAFQGHSQNGPYGDWVEEVDWSAGQVLQTLRDLKLADNTLVIFTSDNGPWLTRGSDAGSAGPLRGGKGSTWEGGLREPTIAWWPSHVKAGSSCDAVAGNIDFLPTFVGLAGAKVPTDKKIDGADMMPLLLGTSRVSPREAQYYFHGYRLEAVRVGPWKLAVRPQNENRGKDGVTEPATLDQPRLYNLELDLGEQHDVAAKYPGVVQRLKALIVAMAAELGDGKPGPAVRPAGHVDNPQTLYPMEEADKDKGTTAPVTGLKPGDTLTGAKAPLVHNRTVTIACEVETPARNGVILAHGGVSVGYALYLEAGHVVFAVRTAQDKITRITSPAEIGAKVAIEARYAAHGAMTLLLDGQQVAKGKAPGLLVHQPAEAFCVGHDDKQPVDGHEGYDGSKQFEGSIRGLKVTTGKAG